MYEIYIYIYNNNYIVCIDLQFRFRGLRLTTRQALDRALDTWKARLDLASATVSPSSGARCREVRRCGFTTRSH